MTEMFAYTLSGILLYFASDWILIRLEQYRGRQFRERNLVYFAIILALALISFALVRVFMPNA